MSKSFRLLACKVIAVSVVLTVLPWAAAFPAEESAGQGAGPAQIGESTDAAQPEALADADETTGYLTPFRIVVVVALSVGALVALAVLLAFRDGRRTVRKLFYLTRNLLGIDVGLRGIVQLGLYSALPAVAVAFTKGFGDADRKGFDWHAFWTVFLVVSAVGVVANVFNRSMTLRRVLSPGAGRVWRVERKSATAAIIQKINRYAGEAVVETEDARAVLRDLLDVIVLHVRDHRGSFRDDRPEVFANLLLVDGNELVVVARDKFSHSPEYQRQVPIRYPKASMLCGRAIESKKALGVGMLTEAYPEGPRNKPYKSILAIPLFGAEANAPYGVLSIDCSRPFFFESFVPGQTENDLENSLQPYSHLITLVLELLVSRDPSQVVTRLSLLPVPHGGKS
jgi:hypothetical protein